MQRRNKKWLIGGCLLVLVLLGGLMLLLRARPMIADETSLQYLRVMVDGEEKNVQEETLYTILSTLRGRRIVQPKTASINGAIEIDVMADGKRLHIVLGEDNYFYWNSERWGYFRITDKEINQKVSALLE